jgi:hypothetical protein
VSNLCRQPVVRVVLNAMAIDDQAGLAIGAALGRACSPAVTLLVGGQQDAGVLDVVSGAPLRTGELLVVGGGSFLQSSVRWFEKNALAPVVDTSTATHLQYSLRDGSVICTRAFSTISAAHDVFIVQVMMAPSGSLVFNAAGYYGPGTTAAGWYVVNSMVPNLATLTKAWYVVEWQDKAAGGVVGQPDAADTWTVLGSGV